MASRFHLVGTQTLNQCIPGPSPSDDDRTQFHTPKLTIREQDEKEGGSESGAKEPGDKSSDGKKSGGKKSRVRTLQTEAQVYPELVKTIKSVFAQANCTRYRVVEHPYHKSPDDGSHHPSDTINDAGIYRATDEALVATTLTAKQRKRSTLSEEKLAEHPDLGLRSWYHMVIPIEMKFNFSSAAFYAKTFVKRPPATSAPSHVASPQPSVETNPSAAQSGESPAPTPSESSTLFIRDTEKGEHALGQLAEYMLNVFKFQHRTFSYAIYVFYDMARLLYFDRTGAFVSESFDWTLPTSLLHDFIWKVAHMDSDALLGYDPTVTVATAEEAKAVREAAKNTGGLHEMVQGYIKDAFREPCPIYKVRVTSCPAHPEDTFPDEVDVFGPTTSIHAEASADDAARNATDRLGRFDGENQYFFIGKPHFAAESLIGRCTRGFIACRVKPDGSVEYSYMKDYWRGRVAGKTRPEHLVYKRLQARMPEAALMGIATLVCGGDVGGPLAQVTMVQDSLPVPRRPIPRVHYRIVTAEIGLPIEAFEDFSHLASIISRVIVVHHHAWNSAQVLHHDVSTGNIMINPDTKEGFIIDWDQSRVKCELDNEPSEPDRTGTWQFRSALSLLLPWKPYRYSDDVESFIHVFHFLVLRYHRTRVRDLYTYVHTTYQHSVTVDGVKWGGEKKYADVKRGSGEAPFEVSGNPELQSVLDQLAFACYSSYSSIDMQEMERRYGLTPLEDNVNKRVTHGIRGFDPMMSLIGLDDSQLQAVVAGPSSEASSPVATTSHTPKLEMTGPLTNIRELVSILLQYRVKGNDKVEDQFEARLYEARSPKVHHLSFLSTSHTQDVPSSADPARSLPNPDTPMRVFGESAIIPSPPPLPPPRAGSSESISHADAIDPGLSPSSVPSSSRAPIGVLGSAANKMSSVPSSVSLSETRGSTVGPGQPHIAPARKRARQSDGQGDAVGVDGHAELQSQTHVPQRPPPARRAKLR